MPSLFFPTSNLILITQDEICVHLIYISLQCRPVSLRDQMTSPYGLGAQNLYSIVRYKRRRNEIQRLFIYLETVTNFIFKKHCERTCSFILEN